MQETWRIIGKDACSLECTTDMCEDDVPFFAAGCTECASSSAAPVNGECPQADPANPVGAPAGTFTGGNTGFDTSDSISAGAITDTSTTPDVGAIVLSSQLETVKDDEKNLLHIIGAALAGALLSALACFFLICCCKRR